MSRGFGSLQRMIIRYLDEKALGADLCNSWSAENYADCRELSAQLGASVENISRAVNALVERGAIRKYPNPARRRNRAYGSMMLPEMDWKEVVRALRP